MNKADLVAKIAGDSGFTKVDAEKALNSMVEGVSSALKNGEAPTLVGFGSFSISKRAARKGRNPKTGQEIQIPAKNVVRFKAGKSLSESV